MTIDLNAAHKHSFHNRESIRSSSRCGCFFCRKTFAATDISSFVDDENTALCPKCGINSVIGDASGASLTETFLSQINKHWFSAG